jgi:CHAT domain-containing protein
VPGLVVLAACDVARSAVQGGEEVLGLAAAFLSLGTSTLVASLLPIVDTAAAGLMVTLHEQIARGVPTAAALAAVQRDAVQSGSPAEYAAAAALVCLGADQRVPLVPVQQGHPHPAVAPRRGRPARPAVAAT